MNHRMIRTLKISFLLIPFMLVGCGTSHYHMLKPEVLTQVSRLDYPLSSIQLYVFTSVDESAYKDGPPLVFNFETTQSDDDFRVSGSKVNSTWQRIKDWFAPNGQIQRGQNFQRIKRSIVLPHKTPAIISAPSGDRIVITVDVGNDIALTFKYFPPNAEFASGGYRLATFKIIQNGITYETPNGAYLFYDEKDLNNIANTVRTEEILPGRRVEDN